MVVGNRRFHARREETTMVEPWLAELLTEIKHGLEQTYGGRLQGVYLFGSRARGEGAPDSDVDILIVLDEVTHYYGELERTAELVARLSLRYDVSISRVFLSISDWRKGEGPFLLTAREDAVAA
jgi:predicted nucleotidyltransferase